MLGAMNGSGVSRGRALWALALLAACGGRATADGTRKNEGQAGTASAGQSPSGEDTGVPTAGGSVPGVGVTAGTTSTGPVPRGGATSIGGTTSTGGTGGTGAGGGNVPSGGKATAGDGTGGTFTGQAGEPPDTSCVPGASGELCDFGKSCSADSKCQFGDCYFPGTKENPICAKHCQDDSACPTGSACAGSFGAPRHCFRICQTPKECWLLNDSPDNPLDCIDLQDDAQPGVTVCVQSSEP